MPVLILASNNKEYENQIAQQIVKQLEYSPLTTHFLHEVADKYSLDQKKLIEAMTNTPSILKRMPVKTWRYLLSCIEVEVLNQLLKDNIVCWGLAAQLYVVVVSHVLKVRLIGSYGDNKQTQISKKESDKTQKTAADQEQRKDKWSMAAFNRKESDPGIYDMVINTDQIQTNEVIDTLVTTLNYPRFKAMTYSKNTLIDKTLAARIKNKLLLKMSDIHVHADNGTVVVTTTSIKRKKTQKINTIKKIAETVDGVGYIEVHWNKDVITEASDSYR